MQKSLLIFLIGSLFFWTGFLVSFAGEFDINTPVQPARDNYNPVSETIRNPSNSDGY